MNWLLERVPTRSRTIAFMIVLIALCAALGSWRASVWAGRAADREQKAAQERILDGQIRMRINGKVAHLRGLASRSEATSASAAAMERESRRLADTDPAGARERYLRAQVERAAASATELGFVSPFDAQYELNWQLDAASQLAELQPKQLTASARDAQDRKVRLVVIYIALIVGIVALTFALLNQGRMRLGLTAAGMAVAVGGVAVFVAQPFVG